MQATRGITKPMSDSLIMLRDEQWKRVRSILTPTFSAAKMKEVSFALLPKRAKQTLKLFEKAIVLIMQSHFMALSL